MADVDPSARAIVDNFLAQFGLQGLGAWAWDKYVALGGGENAMAQINLELPDQPAYTARFPAAKRLAAQGRAMTPAEMLQYERQARELFHAAGLPPGFYDSPDDFGGFMEKGTSVVELQQRVQLAQRASYEYDAEEKAALLNLYGMSEGDFVAWVINPDIAVPLVEQRFIAAQATGTLARQGVTIGRATAEDIAGMPNAASQIGANAAELGRLQQSGVFAETFGESTDLTAEGAGVGATFGQNAPATDALQRRVEKRVAGTKGSGGLSTTQRGVSGSGKAPKT